MTSSTSDINISNDNPSKDIFGLFWNMNVWNVNTKHLTNKELIKIFTTLISFLPVYIFHL